MRLRSGKLPFLGSEDEFFDHTRSQRAQLISGFACYPAVYCANSHHYSRYPHRPTAPAGLLSDGRQPYRASSSATKRQRRCPLKSARQKGRNQLGLASLFRRTTEARCGLNWREQYPIWSYFRAKYTRSEVSAERTEGDALFPNIASCVVVFEPIEKPATSVHGLLSFSAFARANPVPPRARSCA